MVTKLRNNKILCILWVLFCSFFFFAAIKQYSIDSLDGYFCRHSTDYTNHYSLVPTTTAAYTTEDISVSYTVVSYPDNINMPTASDYTGYTAFIFYMTMAGFLLCIVGGFFFNGFHPKLYQEVFLFLFFFCLFQLLGDSLPVLIYQNFGKLVWPFLFLCIVLGIICAVSLLCFLWSWNSKGFHGSFKKSLPKSFHLRFSMLFLHLLFYLQLPAPYSLELSEPIFTIFNPQNFLYHFSFLLR